MNNCKVSIIIPVYNVEDYIDECLKSVVNQTFTDVEILLIIGKSTDNSTKKCREWAEKDVRIKLINELQRGLGSARNYGVECASGEYVVFIDSDDYIHETYVEELYSAVIKEDADVAECDFYRIRQFSNKMNYVVCTAIMGKDLNIMQKFQMGRVSMWKLMIKKSLLIDFEIRQPNPPAEDFVTYPLIMLCAKKIVSVNKPLYYYRKDRPNNLSEEFKKQSNMQIYINTDVLMENFLKRNLFEVNKEALSAYIRRWFSGHMSLSLGSILDQEYIKRRDEYIRKYEQYFSEYPIKKTMLCGSYNLVKIINKLQTIEDPFRRIQFSSIIGIMSEKEKIYEVVHPNIYRQYMIQREFSNEFEDILGEEKPECFYFDLLEERHDIIKINNSYYTKSDAYDGAVIKGLDSYEVIERKSYICDELWKKSCDKFFELLFQYMEPNKIYLIENYLAEEYSDGKNLFEYKNLKEIQSTNSILKKYYTYIKETYTQIKIVEAYKVEEYVTDVNYEFGCYPWHLNEWANIRIAQQIEKELK